MVAAKEITLKALRRELGEAQDNLCRANMQTERATDEEMKSIYLDWAVAYMARTIEIERAIAWVESL